MPAREGVEFSTVPGSGVGGPVLEDYSLLIFPHMAWKKVVTLTSLILTKNEYCDW